MRVSRVEIGGGKVVRDRPANRERERERERERKREGEGD
jgi:hypothetical protein